MNPKNNKQEVLIEEMKTATDDDETLAEKVIDVIKDSATRPKQSSLTEA